ncbi:MAG TPA: hypothetical protein PLJ21_02720, partial [Pseudobdellovibrionaceae bacterium]|nr:hypothetical protein [Pseudobdellovibrionaceae bacterium]
AGTYTHNNGTLTFDYSNGASNGTGNIDVPSGVSFWNVNFVSTSYNVNWSLGAGQAITVLNNFTQKRVGAGLVTINNGTIYVAKDLYIGDGAAGGSATIELNQAGNQYYYNTGTGYLPTLKINKPSESLSPDVSSTNLSIQALYLLSGELVAPTGIFRIIKTAAFTTTVFQYTAGTYTHNNGTLTFDYSNGASHGTGNIDVPIGISFWNLNFATTLYNATWTLGAGQTINVQNNYTQKRVSGGNSVTVNNGIIYIAKDITVEAGANGGSTALVLNGTGNQTFTSAAGTVPGGTWTIDKTSGSFILANNLSLSTAGQDLTINQGTVDLNGNILTVNDYLTINASGMLTVNGGSFSPNTLPKFVNNGTLN